MQRVSTATARIFAGAIGLGLALPSSFASAAPYGSADAAAPMPARWQSYALAAITPGFAWATVIDAREPRVSDELADVRAFAFALASAGLEPSAFIGLSVSRRTLDERPLNLSLPAPDVAAELPHAGLQRTVIAPSWVQRWGGSGTFGVTAVLAYQRFVTLGLGEVSIIDDAPFWPAMPAETSWGGCASTPATASASVSAGTSPTSRASTWTRSRLPRRVFGRASSTSRPAPRCR